MASRRRSVCSAHSVANTLAAHRGGAKIEDSQARFTGLWWLAGNEGIEKENGNYYSKPKARLMFLQFKNL